ncbi:MAG TPA: hypothetical protein EYP78_02515, partial [Candidatus Omnitrophica bacterium]|nr:hypothetical protein [Candidatus Omnitrophota bacterium]
MKAVRRDRSFLLFSQGRFLIALFVTLLILQLQTAFIAFGATEIYAGGYEPGVVYSYMGGIRWDIISPELGVSVHSLVKYDGYLYAGVRSRTNIGQVWRFDGWENFSSENPKWTKVGDNMEEQVDVLIVYHDKLYAGTSWGPARLYRYDGNSTWTIVVDCSIDPSCNTWSGFRSAYVWEDRLYLGDIGWDKIGYYDGTSFMQVFPVPDEFIGSCIWNFVSFNGILYAGAFSGTLYRSIDGINWNNFWHDLDSRDLFALQKFQGDLYIGTDQHNTQAELLKYDGVSFTSVWQKSVTNYHEGILSLASDGDDLYIGMGGDAKYYREEGIGQVYRYDGSQVQLISGMLGKGIQVLYIPSTPEWRRDLQEGDLLLVNNTMSPVLNLQWMANLKSLHLTEGRYWTHVGIYVGHGKVVEALFPKVVYSNITEWDPPATLRKNAVEILSISSANEGIRRNVADFAKRQVGKRYDLKWVQKKSDPNSLSWYCSELAWAAYINQGSEYDIEETSDNFVVMPKEIHDSPKTRRINLWGTPTDLSGRLPIVIAVLSPVEIAVTDPDGLRISKELNEILMEHPEDGIPGALYVVDDFNEDGKPDDIIVIPDSKVGTYQISVIPKPDTSPTDIYTLEVTVGAKTTVLAKDVPVSDIPKEPYVFTVKAPPPPIIPPTFADLEVMRDLTEATRGEADWLRFSISMSYDQLAMIWEEMSEILELLSPSSSEGSSQLNLETRLRALILRTEVILE